MDMQIPPTVRPLKWILMLVNAIDTYAEKGWFVSTMPDLNQERSA